MIVACCLVCLVQLSMRWVEIELNKNEIDSNRVKQIRDSNKRLKQMLDLIREPIKSRQHIIYS